MGTPKAAVPPLDALLKAGHEVTAVYTQPDRPSGRGRKVSFSPIKEYSVKHGLVVEQPKALRDDEVLKNFISKRADVTVVVAYGRILPPEFLKASPFGSVNLHFSLLPKYRGAAPVNWALANGERLTGVTTMLMDAGLDTGPILLQEIVEIGNEETAPELTERLSIVGAELLVATLEKFEQIVPKKQSETDASYAPILRKSEGLINWSLSALAISNRVRGFQPFPGSYTFLDGSRMLIWSARPSSSTIDITTQPGTIMRAEGGILEVACGERTAILIDELQFEGKRRISATDALNSGLIKEGYRFSGET